MKLNYTEEMSGYCPIQAEGLTEDGLPWYFKARFSVSLTIGNGNKTKTGDMLHPLSDTLIRIDNSAIPFESDDHPGCAEFDVCEKWIIKALEYFKNHQNETNNK